MACTYAGVGLAVPTAEVIDWIKSHISVEETIVWETPDTKDKNRWWWAHELALDLPKVEPGLLYYPAGAIRFGVGYFLVTDNLLAQIRSIVFNGSQLQSAPLVLSSAVGKISTNMWMLPPLPLAQLPFQNGLYLLTLVDDRYWWWFNNTGQTDIVEKQSPTSWLSLYQTIINTLSPPTTLTVDTINPQYLTPSSGLTNRQEPVSIFLQSIAANVGQNIIRQLNGTIYAMGKNTAAGIANQNLAGIQSLWAGGVFGWKNLFQPLARALDLNMNTPSSVTVTFPKKVQTSNQGYQTGTFISNGKTYPITLTLTSLNIPEYAGISGIVNKTKVLQDSCVAAFNFDTDTTPLNTTELQSLATQIATDWYTGRLGAAQLKVKGIYPWQPESRDPVVIWKYQDDEISTFVERPGWNDNLEVLNHASAIYGSVNMNWPGVTEFPKTVEFGPASDQHESGVMTIEANPGGPTVGGTVQCSNVGPYPTGNLVPQLQTVANYPTGPIDVAAMGALRWNTPDQVLWITTGQTNPLTGTVFTPVGPAFVRCLSAIPAPIIPGQTAPECDSTIQHPVTKFSFVGSQVFPGKEPWEAIIVNSSFLTPPVPSPNPPPPYNPPPYCPPPCTNPPPYPPPPIGYPPPWFHYLLSWLHPDTLPCSPPGTGDLVIGQNFGGSSLPVSSRCDPNGAPNGVLWTDFKGNQCSTTLYLSEANGQAGWLPGTIFVGYVGGSGCTATGAGKNTPTIVNGNVPVLLFAGSCFMSTNTTQSQKPTYDVCDTNPLNWPQVKEQTVWCGFIVESLDAQGNDTIFPNVTDLLFGSDFSVSSTTPAICPSEPSDNGTVNHTKILLAINNTPPGVPPGGPGDCPLTVPYSGEIVLLCNATFDSTNCILALTTITLTVCNGRIFDVQAEGDPPTCQQVSLSN